MAHEPTGKLKLARSHEIMAICRAWPSNAIDFLQDRGR